MIENISFLARQIFFELIFGPPTLIYLKFGPLAKKVGHPCKFRSNFKKFKNWFKILDVLNTNSCLNQGFPRRRVMVEFEWVDRFGAMLKFTQSTIINMNLPQSSKIRGFQSTQKKITGHENFKHIFLVRTVVWIEQHFKNNYFLGCVLAHIFFSHFFLVQL